MTQPAGDPSLGVAARCYRHPGREALVRCVRCERPICPDCMRPASVGFHCPDDVAHGRRSVRAPRSGVGARLRSAPPFVTTALVALNVAAYLVSGLQSGGSLTDPTGSQLFYDWQLFPLAVHDQDQYYRLITSAFLHLSLLHILSNMLALALVGPTVERVLGWWRFTATYLLAALGGAAAVYAFGSQLTPTAGASGAIFGLFGACLVLARRIGLDLQWLVGIIVVNFILTFSIAGISKLDHIGGFVTGVLVGVAIGGLPSLRRRVPNRVQAGGLTSVLVLVALVIGVRAATW